MAFLRRVAVLVARVVRCVASTLRKGVAEIAVAACLLGGWFALAYGVATLLGRHVWPFAIAVLLFSLGGWQLTWRVVKRGLYVLSREEPPKNA